MKSFTFIIIVFLCLSGISFCQNKKSFEVRNQNDLNNLNKLVETDTTFDLIKIITEERLNISDVLRKVKGLTQLIINPSGIENLALSMSSLNNISKIKLVSYQDNNYDLTELFDTLATLPKLSILELIGINWNIKENIYKLVNIEELKIKDCHIDTLPGNISKLKKLKHFWLEDNGIKSIEQFLNNLDTTSRLESLVVYDDSLESLPANIPKLLKLKDLRLLGSKLNNLPGNLGELENLEYLFINMKKLRSLPESIVNLKKIILVQVISPQEQLKNQIELLRKNMLWCNFVAN